MKKSIAILVALGWAGCALGADKPEFGPPAPWVHPAKLPTDAGPNSGADVKYLLVDRQLNFSPQANELYIESVARIQTPQGLSTLGNLVVPWNPQTDVLTVHKLHILRGDQVIDVLASGQTFTVLRRENNLQYAALDGVLTAVIQPAGLQVGDSVDLAYSISRSDPVLGGISEEIAEAWAAAPVSRLRVRASWATAMPLRWKELGQSVGAKENHVGRLTEVTLAIDNLEPQVVPKGAPVRFRMGNRLEFTGFAAWSDVSKRLAPLYVRAATLAPQSPLQAELTRIRADSTDPQVQVAQALELVEDKVRYVFLGMNQGNLVPAQADLTWERRFGDCKAKTALLIALLHGLGFDAQPVAVNTTLGDGLDARLPMVGQFDHVVVVAHIADRTYWLDPTRIGDRRLDEMPTPAFGWGLPLVETGSDLVRIVQQPPTHLMAVTTTRIDASAGIYLPAPFHAETLLEGDLATLTGSGFNNLTPATRDTQMRALWKKSYAFVNVQSVAFNFDDRKSEVRLTMDGLASLDWGGHAYEADDMTLGYKPDFTRLPGPNQDAPFLVPFPVYAANRESIQLPPDEVFTVVGEDIDRKIAGVEYRRHASIEKGLFNVEASSRSVDTEFPAAEADAAAKAMTEMSQTTVEIHMPSGYAPTDKEAAAGLATWPDAVNGYVGRGNRALDRGDLDAAIADYNRALAIDGRSAFALADRALAQMRKKNALLAQKDLDAAFAIDSRNPVVFRGRGWLALDAGNATDAVADFTQSLELEPGNEYTLEMRARSYVKAGDTDKALADIEAILQKSPGRVDMFSFHALLLQQEKKTDLLIADAKAVVAANANDAKAHAIAGQIYATVGNLPECLREFDGAVRLAPGDAGYLLSRASCRPATEVAERRKDVEAALKVDPGSTTALSYLERFQSTAGQYQEALATIETIKGKTGENVHLITVRGVLNVRAGHPELAAQDFSAARVKATSAGELNDMCWEIAILGQSLDVALEACDAAVAKSPASAAIQDSRGFVLMRMGRYDDSIAAYDSALAILPSLSTSLYGRGIAKLRKGDAAGAEADLQAALAARPAVQDQFKSYGVER